MMSIGNVIRKIVRNFVPYRISQKLLSLLLTAYSDGGISENEIKTISYLQKRLLREYPAIKYVLFDVGANIGNYSLDLIQQNTLMGKEFVKSVTPPILLDLAKWIRGVLSQTPFYGVSGNFFYMAGCT